MLLGAEEFGGYKMSSSPIKSVIFLGENQLTAQDPLYLGEELVEKIYLGEMCIYRIIKPKVNNQ